MIRRVARAVCLALLITTLPAVAALAEEPSSYSPVVAKEGFAETLQRMRADKAKVMKRHQDLLAQRYDLADRPAAGVTSALKTVDLEDTVEFFSLVLQTQLTAAEKTDLVAFMRAL